MASINNSVLPLGSKILVTGANGYIGSHIVDQALEYGYKVRGAVRSIERSCWMLEYFDKKFGEGLFGLVEIPDMTKIGAFDQALEGCSGVVHVASVVNLDPNPENVIPSAVNSTLGILKSAAKTAGVKRFVLTSSATAAANPKPNDASLITKDSWNEESVELSKNLPEALSDAEKGFFVYGASKVKGEQVMWQWAKDNSSEMIINCGKLDAKSQKENSTDGCKVLPGGNFGKILSVEHQGYPSTAFMAHALFVNDQESIQTFIKDYPAEWFVDVQDTGRLHIAALTDSSVVNERLFAYAAPYNWNIVLQEFRVLFSDREFMQDVPGIWEDLTQIEQRGRAEELLRRMGRPGFTTLRDSLLMLTKSSLNLSSK